MDHVVLTTVTKSAHPVPVALVMASVAAELISAVRVTATPANARTQIHQSHQMAPVGPNLTTGPVQVLHSVIAARHRGTAEVHRIIVPLGTAILAHAVLMRAGRASTAAADPISRGIRCVRAVRLESVVQSMGIVEAPLTTAGQETVIVVLVKVRKGVFCCIITWFGVLA